MRTVCVCVLLSALLVAGCASSKGESYATAGYDFSRLDKVAIVSVTGQVYGEAAKTAISDDFTMELIKKGYAVILRSEMQALLKEQEFQASGITSDQDAARAGRILNVPAVVLISIPKYGKEKMEMTAKLVEVETGTILWIGRTIGAVAGGVLGGVAGNALSPEQREQVRKVIAKVCKTLPSRIPQTMQR
jgi:hypothetical protein